ncbi:transposable element Tc1 transposase [Trichonephila clavipes]|nr:transposable element Tc1 transposase [Trichonephila clavipes]
MSSRHHIDDFMRGRIIGKIEEGRKITDVVREFDIAHSVGTGEVVLEVRRLQKTDISSYQQKGTGAPQLSRWQISFLLPQESRSPEKTVARRLREGGLYARRPVVCIPLTRQHRTARLQWCREHHNWTEQDWACVLFSDESRFSLSSDCRRQPDLAREWYCLSSRKISTKRTDIRHAVSGVGRHHDQWPHSPTCGCKVNGTMTGQRCIDEFYFLMFVFSVVLSVEINLFYGRQRNMSSNTCCLGLSRQRGYSTSRMASAFSDLNPIENVWDALGGKLLVETILRQTRTPSSVHSQRNGINCLNSCWIMLCKVWYDVWNVASHSTVDISRTDTFL